MNTCAPMVLQKQEKNHYDHGLFCTDKSKEITAQMQTICTLKR